MGEVSIIGAGLAGCEAALWLANSGVKVTLYEQKPLHFSPAHKNPNLAELVCSNSLKASGLESAAGLLKEEMRLLGSALLPAAQKWAVPAGGALAVDRDEFSKQVTALIKQHPGIALISHCAEELPKEKIAIVASGPLTQGPLAKEIAKLCGQNQLSFYDAAAPIITADSIDKTKVFAAARYGKGNADYLNCPMDKEGYTAFYKELIAAQTAPLNSFDTAQDAAQKVPVYEGCMPLELMAKRGENTLRFGPLRPVGLVNPATGHRPWACVQLRQENAKKTLYNLVGFQTNLKFAQQRRVFAMIPGLENADFVRFGVMHRNTFLNSPQVLNPDMCLKNHENIFFAGQITGLEGYMESAMCGLLAARSVFARLNGKAFVPPPQNTMCGALCAHLGTKNQNFQPMGANMGLLPPLEVFCKDKRQRYAQLANTAVLAMAKWLAN